MRLLSHYHRSRSLMLGLLLVFQCASSLTDLTWRSASNISCFHMLIVKRFAKRQEAPQHDTYEDRSLLPSAVLNSTNFHRSQHNSSALVWNDTLAKFASTVTDTCTFSHSGGPYGENLAAGYDDVSGTIDAWAHEQYEYNFDKPGFSESTGHFTQLVWKSTAAVGCSVKQCNGNYDGVGSKAPGWFLVCEYWPRGNVLGRFEDEVDPRIAQPQPIAEGAREEIRGTKIVGVLVFGLLLGIIFIWGD